MVTKGILNYLPKMNAFTVQYSPNGYEAVIDRPGIIICLDTGEETVAYPYSVILVGWIGKMVE